MKKEQFLFRGYVIAQTNNRSDIEKRCKGAMKKKDNYSNKGLKCLCDLNSEDTVSE